VSARLAAIEPPIDARPHEKGIERRWLLRTAKLERALHEWAKLIDGDVDQIVPDEAIRSSLVLGVLVRDNVRDGFGEFGIAPARGGTPSSRTHA
jgi:hypothetical protein